jgi:hypothetical protein
MHACAISTGPHVDLVRRAMGATEKDDVLVSRGGDIIIRSSDQDRLLALQATEAGAGGS